MHKARSTVSEGCHGERVRFGLFQPPGQGQGKGGACAREFLVSDVYAPRAHGDTHLRPAPHQAAIPSARHRAAARSGGAPAALSPQPWVPPAAASLPWRRRQPRACRGSAAGHLACTRLSDSGCFSRVLRGASEEGVQSTSLVANGLCGEGKETRRRAGTSFPPGEGGKACVACLHRTRAHRERVLDRQRRYATALPAANCTELSACDSADSRTARCQDVLRLVKQEQQERAEMLARYHNDPRACLIKRMGPGGGDVAGEAERLASVPAAGPQRPPSPTSFVTEFERVASGGSQQEAAVGMDPAHQVRTVGVRTERRLCPPH